MIAEKNLSKQDPIKHVVSFKFKEDAKFEEIEKLQNSFLMLKDKIPGVLSISGGKNNSPENLNKGFSHCFIITFLNHQAREEYLPHPKHQEFVSQLRPVIEDVFVIDFSFKA
jgi:hypothetical protein